MADAAALTDAHKAALLAFLEASIRDAPHAADLGTRLAAAGEGIRVGIARLAGWSPVSLREKAALLAPKRLSDAVRAQLLEDARAAVRAARTWRAVGQLLGRLLDALAKRYGA